MRRAFTKTTLKQLFADTITIMVIGFLLVLSLLAYEYWVAGKSGNISGTAPIIESSKLNIEKGK